MFRGFILDISDESMWAYFEEHTGRTQVMIDWVWRRYKLSNK